MENLLKTVIFTRVSIDFDDAPEFLDTGNLFQTVTFTRVSIHFDAAPEVLDTWKIDAFLDFHANPSVTSEARIP